MKERPILFSAPMVRAILNGSKTQTRRICKPAEQHGLSRVIPTYNSEDGEQRPPYITPGWFGDEEGDILFCCPYGVPCDRLWVRETWGLNEPNPCSYDPIDERGLPDSAYIMANGAKHVLDFWRDRIVFRASIKGNYTDREVKRWRPSIHMPRWVSRIMLEITDVRVERLHDISEHDAMAEGCAGGHGSIPDYAYNASSDEHYSWLWDSINGAGSWNANPWVWVIEFNRINEVPI